MGKKFFRKRERGFNMFSAVVAVILIMTSVVLTNTLISTEEKTDRQVYSMLNNYQLADAANIARADALQSFNFNFRSQLEDYLTYSPSEMPEAGYTLFTVRSGQDTFGFDDMKKSFETNILLTDQDSGQQFDAALRYVAEKTVDQFNEGTYGRFSVHLSDNSQAAKNAIFSSIKSVLNNGDFLEVVGCSETDCPLGTFYFNVPLNQLSDSNYDALPRIVVKDVVTNEEIKMAILPKTNLKIYIPLRYFKVLWEARLAARAMENAHEKLASAQLGFCDRECKPNNDPQSLSSKAPWTSACPTVSSGTTANLNETFAGVSTYLAGGIDAGQKGLRAYGGQLICQTAVDSGAFNIDNSTPGIDGFNVYDTFLAPEQNGREVEINNCGLNHLDIRTGGQITSMIENDLTGSSTPFLYCGKIQEVWADIAYKETNPHYIVRGTFDDGQSDVYKIRIHDLGFMQVTSSGISPDTLWKCTSTSVPGSCTPS